MGKKGKARNGRAKQKQKAQTHHSHHHMRGPAPALDYSDDDAAFTMFRGFALPGNAGEMARQVKHKHRPLGEKLYLKTITFVPASTNTSQPQSEPETTREEILEVERISDMVEDRQMELHNTTTEYTKQTTTSITEAAIEAPHENLARMQIDGRPTPKASGNIAATGCSTATTTSAITTSESSQFRVIGDDSVLDGRRAEPGSPEALPFVVDTTGDHGLTGGTLKRVPVRSGSPVPSDSSEEVVVFHGRGRATVIDDPILQPATNSKTTSLPIASPVGHVTDDLMRALQSDRAPSQGTWPTNTSTTTTEAQNSQWIPAPDIPYWRKDKHHGKTSQLTTNSKTNGTTTETSTLQNGKKRNGDSRSTRHGQEVLLQNGASAGNDLLSVVQSAKKKGKKVKVGKGKRGKKTKAQKRAERLLDMGITDSDEGTSQAGSEAAYDDYMANIRAQMEEDDDNEDPLAKTKAIMSSVAISGPSLVVDGREIADDEVLPDATKYENSDEWVDEDDDSSSEDHVDPDDLSSFDSSDLEDELEYTEREQWEDEEDLRQRRIARMTDSRLARLLAKQIELGIEDDNLVIEDGDFDEMSDGVGDLSAARAGLLEITNGRSNKRGSRARSGKGKHGFAYPDASALADTVEQYGDEAFDIMDMDRPSLRPTKKGRKGKIPDVLEELSDEDLKLSMASTWDKDRAKKRQKKLEREELRREGLLGRNGHVDLKSKYQFGMTMSHVHHELEVFLRDDSVEQRAFPPMFKHDRKSLHDACNRLGLTSKSQGAGNSRFTVVSKTLRTAAAGDVQRLLGKGGFGRMSRKHLKESATRRGGGGGGGVSKSAASFRNGEIVGAGVPELGRENKGHRLMEKMGWSKGMALGKDGEGILQPVEQIVRIGTAGLGGSR